MNTLAALRWSGATWLFPVLFGLGVYIGLTNPPAEAGYRAADFSAASRAVVLLGPLLAAVLALRARTLLTFLRVSRGARTNLVAVLGAVWPLLLGGPVAGVVALVSATRSLPLDGMSLAISMVVLMTLLACGGVGILLARVLPTVVSVPLSAVLSFAWLALPGSGSNVVLRNLNSSFVGCCTPEQEPAASLLWGSLALTSVVVLGAAVSAGTRFWVHAPRARTGAVAVAVLVASSLAGVGAARAPGEPLNLMAVEERSTPMVCRSHGGTEICLWPEHEQRRPEVLAAAASMNEGLVGIGVPVLERLSERSGGEGVVQLTASSYSRPSDILFSLAQGVLTVGQECREAGTGTAFIEALAFVSLVGGLDEDEVARRVPSDAVDRARAMRARPAVQQKRYLDGAVDDVASTCRTDR